MSSPNLLSSETPAGLQNNLSTTPMTWGKSFSSPNILLSPSKSASPLTEAQRERIEKYQRIRHLQTMYSSPTFTLDKNGLFITTQELCSKKKELLRSYTDLSRKIVQNSTPKASPRQNKVPELGLQNRKLLMEKFTKMAREAIHNSPTRKITVDKDSLKYKIQMSKRQKKKLRALQKRLLRESREKVKELQKTGSPRRVPKTGFQLEMERLEAEKKKREEMKAAKKINYPKVKTVPWSKEEALIATRFHNKNKKQVPKLKYKRRKQKKKDKKKKKVEEEPKPVEIEEPIVKEEPEKKEEEEVVVEEKKEEDPKRIMVIGEIIKTEKTYLNSLSTVLELYYNPAEKDKILPSNTLQLIFADFKVIKGVNTKFYESLIVWLRHNPDLIEKLCEKYKDDFFRKEVENDVVESPRRVDSLGLTINRLAPTFKLYTNFINNYDKIVSAIENETKNNNEFAALRQAATEELMRRGSRQCDISSLIIQPVQRIPRYRLLLQELIKYTDKDHPDYEPLTTALKSFCYIADYCNQNRRLSESTNRVKEIAREYNFNELIEPSRKVILEDLKVKYESKSKGLKPVRVHVFNDAILISKIYKSKKRHTLIEFKKDNPTNVQIEKVVGLDIDNIDEDIALSIKDDNSEKILYFETTEKRDACYDAVVNALSKL